MVFPQVTKDLQKEGHPRRLQSSAGQHQALIMQPLVVQHYAQNVHTEVQLGLAPPLSGGGSTGGGSGGGFFGSGLFRTSGRPPSSSNRPRAYSMLPLTSSISQEEKANMSSNTKKHSNRSHKRYYPLSQEDTLELLLLLNQGKEECQCLSQAMLTLCEKWQQQRVAPVHRHYADHRDPSAKCSTQWRL
ncbi:hypothetical protein L3Y34_010811 [Caenorhabditis briggsae]|uniref:Uncharacterized protein n=1 Tax=Caenorhabditis briggsae TaxID=6238 RepID=A0AAE8ZUP7_CAEBR|nr:hypothetical protein L3Y34_010811 [Caenorhabditis briggsae]